ncbi:MAG: S46 family peptidase [Gemmatimonadetes bacterium]|nr:S46 family peptidase [Gemmatimonadota bacterium]
MGRNRRRGHGLGVRGFQAAVLAAVLALGVAACAGGAGRAGGPAATAPRPAARPPETAPPAPAWAPAGVLLDTIRAGRYDNGKMWTFEFPPVDYLRETHGFAPDTSWFRRARLGALRIPGCSASFVSRYGLVLTNHHCAREGVSKVTHAGEKLLDSGFYAASLDEERRVEEFHADQLLAVVDVTDEVYSALERVPEERRGEARDSILEAIEERSTRERGGEEAGIVVEMISLYNGGRYSAYVFHRYTDVRLVIAPELQIGFFGGDPDNFTYPRYDLDFSFFRVYGEDGKPLETETYFPWSPEGVEDGDLVFVIGNPGSTSRLQTMAELEFRRDVSDQGVLEFIRSRVAALQRFLKEYPVEAEALDIRNKIFSLTNSEKAYAGMLDGLRDPVILARRRDAERQFHDSLQSRPERREKHGALIDRMAELQAGKREVAPGFGAFLALTSEDYASATLRRALFAYQLLSLRERSAGEERLSGIQEQLLAVKDQPAALDEGLMQAAFEDLIRSYGRDSDVVRAVLQGRSPEGAASEVRAKSVLADSARAAAALERGALGPDDPALRVVAGYFARLQSFQQTVSQVFAEEEEVAAELGRARFEIYGTAVPPDATFSLRIADGVVKGYDYNGTIAPYKTTFHGLYDRHYSFAGRSEWELPGRWRQAPATFDRSTPLDFVSTADIIGGNSGSPVLDRELRLVGVVFDGNIESLTADYIYLPDRSRAVAVDARGILEALDEVYDADRIVLELTSQRLAPSEAEADRIRAAR